VNKAMVANALAQRIAFCRVMADKSAEHYQVYRTAADQLYAVADMLEIVIDPERVQKHPDRYKQVLNKE
jgi:hypothetical protein